jgi:hypothetical protein
VPEIAVKRRREEKKATPWPTAVEQGICSENRVKMVKTA